MVHDRRGHLAVGGRERGAMRREGRKSREPEIYIFQVPERPKVFALTRCLCGMAAGELNHMP